MSQFKKKPVVIEAITFAELIQYGIENGANIVNEIPWSFQYKGHPITHENDECYLIPTLEGTHNFTPKDVLITGIQGEIYPCKIDIFEASYEPVEKTSEMTFEEASEFLKIGQSIALPEWKGFWFGVVKTGELLVLTKEGEILNTPHEEYKQRNDWMVVEPNEVQQKILDEYFKNLPRVLTFGQKLVGLNFNPSNDDQVGKVKQLFADILDAIGDPTADTERRSYSYNIIRTQAINTTMLAQMAVVKFLTWRE